MSKALSREEVATLIKGRKVLRALGLNLDADVTTICKAAGISRKTAYDWANQAVLEEQKKDELQEEVERLEADKKELEKRYDDILFENEGRKVAWDIHGVDELLRSKKNT